MGDSEASTETPAAETVVEAPPASPTPEKAPTEPAPDAQPPSEPAAPGAYDAPKAAVDKDTGLAPVQKKTATILKKPSFSHPVRQSRELGGRRSKDKSAFFSSIFLKQDSGMGFQERAKIPKYMNSYKLEADNPFNADKVQRIIVQVLKESIEDNMIYDSDSCPIKAKAVSGLIRTKVKELDFDRYKLVCLVTIGEKKSYDIFSAVRFMWDAEKDSFASHVHENMYVYVVASVFGLYYE